MLQILEHEKKQEEEVNGKTQKNQSSKGSRVKENLV